MKNKEVVIIQNIIPHYRKDFFLGLREKLNNEGVKLTLIYGPGLDSDKRGKSGIHLPGALSIKSIRVNLLGYKLHWKPCLKYLKKADLVIVEQANKNLINYYLMFRRLFSTKKVAFWGHGRNRQSPVNSLENRFKRIILKGCDWWFAYTAGVRDYLVGQGFSGSKITIVQNAINTEEMHMSYNAIPDHEVDQLVKEFDLTEQRKVGIYCGGIYEEKRIDFLIEACDRIHEKLPEFVLFVIGSGDQSYKVAYASKERYWLHYVGPMFGREKLKYFKVSDFFLMPGLVGLAVLDSFALGTPMITTDYEYHSPEIEYLVHGFNGLVISNNLDTYANQCVLAFTDKTLQTKLLAGCEISFKKYTVKRMVSNFSEGILKCLNGIK